MDELMQIEQQLEKDMLSAGYHQFIREIAAAKEGEREGTTIYGNMLIRNAIDSVAARIRKFLEEQAVVKSRPMVAVKALELLDPEVAAFIALRCMIDRLSTNHIKLSASAMYIGRAIETELRLAEFEEAYRPLFRKVSASLDQRTANIRHRRTVLLHTATQHTDTFEKWTQNFLLHIGMALLTFVIEETGLFKDAMIFRRKQSVRVITATPEVIELCESVTERAALLSPSRSPMVVPPKPWTAMHNGGYYFMPKGTQQLVKEHSGNPSEEINNLIPSMPDVLEALNVAQATPWRINRQVFAVVNKLWENNVSVGLLNRFDPMDLPSKPADIATNEEVRLAWRQAARVVHEGNRRSLSKRVQTARVVSIARSYEEREAIYFPHEFDFRGRIYPVPGILNPQGGDLSRGLLEFADGMSINNDEACRWHAIQGANAYGKDKLSLDDRAEWVLLNYKEILQVGNDPLAHTWWHGADDPWQFLAFCIDIANIQRDPKWKSRLVVAMDGSCNGLQHFSAMLRDSVGGAATNLLPSSEPADIYQQVADLTVRKLRQIHLAKGGADAALAKVWLDFGIDRKITKRPVMVLPYGGTVHSCRAYIEEAVREREGDPPLSDKEMWKATYWLAVIVWEAIGETVEAARQAMTWLQAVAKLVSKAGLPLVWTLPDGFPVFQRYMNQKDKRVKTKLGSQIIKVSLYHNLDKVDANKQALATPPNFVHSYDALCLRHYLLIAHDEGIRHFGTIHDSYGVHAANAALSAACLRAAFVDVYANVDPLARLEAEVRQALTPEEAAEIPPRPSLGTLNIEEVKDAEYFFA